MLPFLKKYLRLNNRQFGYRSDTSCLSAISIVKEIINKYNSEGSVVYGAIVDLSKAFGKVNKNILFRKLYDCGLHPKIIEIIRSMYEETYVHTSFNKVKGDSWKVKNGVRQGAILSPLLFSFYMNEILDSLCELPIGCAIDGYKTNVFCFADDIILLAPTSQALQKLLDIVHEKLTALCLTINTKSKYIVFRSNKCNHRNVTAPPVNINGVDLEQVSTCKYLGVLLSDNGNIGMDIDRAISSFLKQFNGMYSKFHFADKKVLFFLFKIYTSSLYGIETWIEKIYDYQLNKISVVYHKAEQRMCGINTWESNYEACDKAGVLIFEQLLAKRMLCFWHRLWRSPSPCLANLKYYFKYKSCLFERISSHSSSKYDVDISENPLCALLARIKYIQSHEERSYYVIE